MRVNRGDRTRVLLGDPQQSFRPGRDRVRDRVGLAALSLLTWRQGRYRVLRHLTAHRHTADRVVAWIREPDRSVGAGGHVRRRRAALARQLPIRSRDRELLEGAARRDAPYRARLPLRKPDCAVRTDGDPVRSGRRRKRVFADFSVQRDAADARPRLCEPKRTVGTGGDVHRATPDVVCGELAPRGVSVDRTPARIDDPQRTVRAPGHVDGRIASGGIDHAQRRPGGRGLEDRLAALFRDHRRAEVPDGAAGADRDATLRHRSRRSRNKRPGGADFGECACFGEARDEYSGACSGHRVRAH